MWNNTSKCILIKIADICGLITFLFWMIHIEYSIVFFYYFKNKRIFLPQFLSW